MYGRKLSILTQSRNQISTRVDIRRKTNENIFVQSTDPWRRVLNDRGHGNVPIFHLYKTCIWPSQYYIMIVFVRKISDEGGKWETNTIVFLSQLMLTTHWVVCVGFYMFNFMLRDLITNKNNKCLCLNCVSLCVFIYLYLCIICLNYTFLVAIICYNIWA